MTIDDKIRDGKLHFDVDRKASKISPLLSGKTDIYEYLTGEEILPPDQSKMIEQAKFAYSSLRKALKKKFEDQVKKQVEAFKFLKSNKKKLIIKDAIHEDELSEVAKHEIETNKTYLKQKI